uniref:Uncharacterized protein n=1 Tax=Mycena chlorophos TaxID=658473 RepID=A0ABQ0LHA9_MYCCL|nr:predicted protein [Mycena chlorophos]
MVASNPLFVGWSLRKFNATVINDVWPEVFFFSAVAAMVACVTKLTSHDLAISNALLSVLGTVLGLVISFRTSSAYERYQEGRKMWTNISIASRNLGQIIWIHVPLNRKDASGRALTTVESVIEKKSMINLVQAFAVAVKHFLREEPGVYFQDLYPLICFLPRYANHLNPTAADMLPLWKASEDERYPLEQAVAPGSSTSSLPVKVEQPTGAGKKLRRAKTFDPEAALADIQAHRPLLPARNPPHTGFLDFFPVLKIFPWMFATCSRRVRATLLHTKNPKKKKGPLAESNVPLEITVYLSAYFAHLLQLGQLAPAVATSFMNNVASLQDTMSNLERIGSTPLPFAYQAHLRMSVWLYLCFLPFQIVASFGYLTIPGTAFAAFLLLGFLEIGSEIENPFQYDLNDLDLDSFCLAIQRELHEITAHTTPAPDDFVFSAWNQPFAPGDRRSAEELAAASKAGDYTHADHGDSEPGMMTIRRVLLWNYREVDRMTRQ